jgi:hypothetical protein
MYRLINLGLCILGFQHLISAGEDENRIQVEENFCNTSYCSENSLTSEDIEILRSFNNNDSERATYGNLHITTGEFLALKEEILKFSYKDKAKDLSVTESFYNGSEFSLENIELITIANYFHWTNVFQDKAYMTSYELQKSESQNLVNLFPRWCQIISYLLQKVRTKMTILGGGNYNSGFGQN